MEDVKKIANPLNFNNCFSHGIYFEKNTQKIVIKSMGELTKHFNDYFLDSGEDILDSNC